MTASKVTDRLYVGDYQEARDVRKNHPGVVIVTVADDCPFTGDYKIDLFDGPAPDSWTLFWRAAALVYHLQEGAKDRPVVMVHCVSGISRSCAVVIAYLMRSRSIGYNAALTELRKVRPVAMPEPFFVELLMADEKKMAESPAA